MEGHKESLYARGPSQSPQARSAFSDRPSKNASFRTKPEADFKIAKDIAVRLNIPFINPLHTNVEPAAIALFEPQMAFRRQALPIRLVDDTLLVAMLTPDQPVTIKGIELLTGYKVKPAAAPKRALSAALERYYGEGKKPTFSGLKNNLVNLNSHQGPQEKSAINISIISNKGGVGKTHLSINLAYTLGGTGSKVLLIDADLGNADISNKLGIFPKYHLLDFLEKKKQMTELIVPTNFQFDLIAGSYGEFKLANLYHAQKIKFINHFKKIGCFYDYVIFDLGAGISRTVLDFALAADYTVIVTTPQDLISGYACTKAGFSRFKEIEDNLAKKIPAYEPNWTFMPMLVANQVSHPHQGFEIYNTLNKTADKNINVLEDRYRIKFEYLGAISYDEKSMRTAERKKRPLLQMFPRAKASQSIQHISKRFSDFENTFDPNISSRNPFKRFAAILSQKT